MNTFGPEDARNAAIYIPPGAHSAPGIDESRYVHEYEHWHLVLQPESNRAMRGPAAGIFVAKRAIASVLELKPEEVADILNILRDGPRQLCEKVGLTYGGNFTQALNEGALSGQTQPIVHGHLYPVAVEDTPPEGFRNGAGAAMEALRATRPDL